MESYQSTAHLLHVLNKEINRVEKRGFYIVCSNLLCKGLQRNERKGAKKDPFCGFAIKMHLKLNSGKKKKRSVLPFVVGQPPHARVK